MRIETYYNSRAIPLIRNFVSEAAKFYGANHKERYALELASEEASLHIISNYPKFFKDLFEIIIEVEPEKKIFSVIMINKGMPVNKDNIPEYSLTNPEESIEGLQFYLIKQLVDEFSFINCGKSGWKTIIKKKLEDFKDPLQEDTEQTLVTTGKQYSLKNITFRVAEPEDAYEITKLAYLTYRYSYGRSMFYYPEVLKENIANGEVISFVAETREGEIVAHTGYVKSRNGEHIFESLALMARLEVRKTLIVAKLLQLQYDFSIENSEKIKVAEVELVTGHTSSQKIAHRYGFSPFALFISYYDQNEFVGINISTERQRETILYALRPTRDVLKSRIFTPVEHRDILTELFNDEKYNTQILTDSARVLEGNTVYSLIKRKDMSLGTIEIERLGSDWLKVIKDNSKNIKFDGLKTIFIKIKANMPLPEDLEDQLTSLGFFFSGCILGPIDEWSLLYLQPVNQKINWDEIKLCHKKALKLKEHIKKNYLKVYQVM